MKIVPWFTILVFLLLAFSCDILRDSPYEVLAWSPGEGYQADPQKIKVAIMLSHDSDRARVEQAFSLTEDRKALKGNFLWEGATLVFIPASPLEAGRDYVISLETGAQDTQGVSLENKFEVSFTTRPPGGRLKVTGAEPEYEGAISANRGEFRLLFSEPVRLNSCLDSISFTPSTSGSWRLEDESMTLCFIPREPWQTGSVYRVKVDKGLESVSGVQLGTDYSSVFYIGEDREKPVLLKVLAHSQSGEDGTISTNNQLTGTYSKEIFFETNALFSPAEYTQWESFTKLELVFSKPVDCSALSSLLSTEPSVSLVMETSPGFSESVVFCFSEYPSWGSSITFHVREGVKDNAGNESIEEYYFRIITGGALSKPPALKGIRLPMSPGNTSDVPGSCDGHEEKSFSMEDNFSDLPIESGEGRYAYMEKVSTWIELYFETAPDTEIDTFSLMDLFRVETTNQALEFSPRKIRTEDFTWASPRDGWENLQRIEVEGFLTNTVQNGVVTFRIPPGLTDKRGNRSTVDFRISLLK